MVEGSSYTLRFVCLMTHARARVSYTIQSLYAGKCAQAARKSALLDTKIRFGRSAAMKRSNYVLC